MIFELLSRMLSGVYKMNKAVPVILTNTKGEPYCNPIPCNIAAITPNDSADLANVSYIRNSSGNPGTVYVSAPTSGTNVAIYLNAGQMTEFPVKRVYLTGLTAGVTLTAHW